MLAAAPEDSIVQRFARPGAGPVGVPGVTSADLRAGFYSDVYFLIAAAANLALSIIASPGGVGPFEVTAQAILIDIFGVSKSAASAYALALHALLLVPVIVVGFVILVYSHLSLAEMLGSRPSKVAVAPPAIE